MDWSRMELIKMEWRLFLSSKSQIFYETTNEMKWNNFCFIKWLSSYDQNDTFWYQHNLYDIFVSV